MRQHPRCAGASWQNLRVQQAGVKSVRTGRSGAGLGGADAARADAAAARRCARAMRVAGAQENARRRAAELPCRAAGRAARQAEAAEVAGAARRAVQAAGAGARARGLGRDAGLSVALDTAGLVSGDADLLAAGDGNRRLAPATCDAGRAAPAGCATSAASTRAAVVRDDIELRAAARGGAADGGDDDQQGEQSWGAHGIRLWDSRDDTEEAVRRRSPFRRATSPAGCTARR